MFCVEIDGPVNVFCDNHGIVKNISIPESTLMKKHNAINYHAVREVVAAGILRVGKEDGETNLVDLLTKVIMGQERWDLGSLPALCLWVLGSSKLKERNQLLRKFSLSSAKDPRKFRQSQTSRNLTSEH
jgi:hypothetical protein